MLTFNFFHRLTFAYTRSDFIYCKVNRNKKQMHLIIVCKLKGNLSAFHLKPRDSVIYWQTFLDKKMKDTHSIKMVILQRLFTINRYRRRKRMLLITRCLSQRLFLIAVYPPLHSWKYQPLPTMKCKGCQKKKDTQSKSIPGNMAKTLTISHLSSMGVGRSVVVDNNNMVDGVGGRVY